MAKKIYLEGGGDVRKGENDKLDKKAMVEAENKRVYVIDLTSSDQDKTSMYRISLQDYFKRLGAEEVSFVSTSKSLSEIKERLSQAGLIYIPGGNTEILMNNIKFKKLENLLKNAKGIIVGNSAGAMILSREAICAYEDRDIMDGFSLLDLAIDVHYDKTHDTKLKILSKKRDMYAIPEKGAIIYDGKLSFVGSVYKFSKGEKTKVN